MRSRYYDPAREAVAEDVLGKGWDVSALVEAVLGLSSDRGHPAAEAVGLPQFGQSSVAIVVSRQPLLKYRQGTRELLQRGTTAFEEWDAYAAVSRYLEDRQRIGGPLRALVPDADGTAVLDASDEPFAALHHTLAARLGLRAPSADERRSPHASEPLASEATPQAEAELQPETYTLYHGPRPMTDDASPPDFFGILGLDPGEPWDQAAFHRALDEKRALWSRQRSGIKTAPATIEARRNLTLVREIERVMLDPLEREKARRTALRERQDTLRRRHDQVAGRLDLMLTKGFLYDVEYEALRSEDALAGDLALRTRLDAADKRPFLQARKDNERLDQAMERNLRANLAILGEPDLYAALRRAEPGISEATPREALGAAADALYRKAKNTADKNRPEVGAMQELADIAKKIFSSDESLRRHNFSMLLAPLDAILERFQQALAPVRAIDSAQFEMFLREAAGKGVNVALAKDVFTGYFRDLGWSVDAPHASAEAWLPDQVPCPHCGVLNDPGGQALRALRTAPAGPCPSCGAPVPVSAGACERCGLRVGMRDWVEYLAEEAEACLERGDLDGAADFLRRGQQAWPLAPDSDDQLAVRLRLARQKLESVRDEQQEAIDQIVTLMDDKLYRAARRQLRRLPFRHPSALQLLAQCETAVRESDRKLAEARRLGVPNERKAVLCLEAFELCADNSAAQRELSRLAPAPPRRLRVEQDDERRVVRLTWDPAPDPGCSSVVVRADRPEPPASAAGRRRYIVRGQGVWEDRDPLVGLPMSYAVYTERDLGGTVSEHAAETPEPVLLTAEVQLTVRPGDGAVELTWTLPENAAGVEIQRDEPPYGTNSRVLATEASVRSMQDRNVRNGVRYRYTAHAVFAYPVPGRPPAERRSQGVIREVIPAAPPAPPGPVYARGHPPPPQMNMYHHKVDLGWPPTGQGVVQVIRSEPGAARLQAGDEFPEEDLPGFGLVLRQPSDIWFQGRLRFCYYTPVLILNGRCYAGEPRRYAAGPEVSDLRAEYAGVAVHVTWTWPDGIDEALVAWDENGEPPDPVAAPLQARVRRAEGIVTGQHDIAARAPARLFVQVAVVVRPDGVEFVSSGADTSARRRALTLRYEVRRGLSQKWELVLRPERQAQLPALVLRGRPDGRPAGPTRWSSR